MPHRGEVIANVTLDLSGVIDKLEEIRLALESADPERLGKAVDGLWSAPQEVRDRMASVLRSIYGPLTQEGWNRVEAVLDNAPSPPAPAAGLSRADYDWAVRELGLTGNGYAKIRAVDEIESKGGWFEDIRTDILELDGPGGFLDGPDLPKILFEAHWFSRLTDGKYDKSHPNISSPKWNRALYIGGQAEYGRLYRAMQLNEQAALKSASWGRYQIMGFNHKAAGYDTVSSFVDAMKESEGRHLEAFVSFIKTKKLSDELDAVGPTASSWQDFTRIYNGPGQVGIYSKLGAIAYRKFA